MKHLSLLSILTVIVALPQVASANAVFDKHCAACHTKGGNMLNPKKTLSKDDLSANGVDSAEAIKNLVSVGAAPMPSFAKTLSADEIDSVTTYVLEQAQKGW